MNHPITAARVLGVGGCCLIAALLLLAAPALAQTYNEPTSATGGATASPLNGADTTQQKLGSLIIGSAGSSRVLCLNRDFSADLATLQADDTHCISAWSEVVGSYVRLQTAAPGSINDPTTYGSADAGYARIQAQGANQLYSLIAETNIAVSNAAAVVGVGSPNGFAGYFQGKVVVKEYDASNPGKLCLNGTGDLSGGQGCIANWNDLTALVPPAGNYVLLQTTPGVATAQAGGAALAGAANLSMTSTAGVVVGQPTSSTPISYTCGDGICSAANGENAGCPLNCACVQDCTVQNQLAVDISGSVPPGTSINDDQGEIQCPDIACSATYSSGTVVSLAYTIDRNYKFCGYQGDCTGQTCTLTMDTNKQVSAYFALKSETCP